MPQRFRLLNEAQVKTLLPMRDLIEAMESALARFSAGEVVQPVRTVLMVGPTKAYFGVMPAYMPHPARIGAKLVTVFNHNEERGLPSHLATIVLLVFVRLQFMASQTSLFQSRLAHAGYVARPLPRWPDSPAADAIQLLVEPAGTRGGERTPSS